MRHIEHLAIETDHARVTGFGEGPYDALSSGDSLGRRREDAVDHFDLIGMDAQLRGEAVAHRVAALGFKAGEIAKIGVDAIDRFDTGGAGAYQAQGAVGRPSASRFDCAPKAAARSSMPQVRPRR